MHGEVMRTREIMWEKPVWLDLRMHGRAQCLLSWEAKLELSCKGLEMQMYLVLEVMGNY